VTSGEKKEKKGKKTPEKGGREKEAPTVLLELPGDRLGKEGKKMTKKEPQPILSTSIYLYHAARAERKREEREGGKEKNMS